MSEGCGPSPSQCPMTADHPYDLQHQQQLCGHQHLSTHSDAEDYLLSFHYLRDAGMFCTRDRGDHMADVLLSLKHAVVHPHQVGHSNPSSPSPPPPTLSGSLPPLSAPYEAYPSHNGKRYPMPAFSPPTSALELPSSILGDSLEESFLDGSRDGAVFSLSCLVSPAQSGGSRPPSPDQASTPPIFSQLTASPPHYDPPNRRGSNGTTPSPSEKTFDQQSHLQTLGASCANSASSCHGHVSMFSPLPNFPSPIRNTSVLLHSPSQPSAFTPVIPLPSFVHPRISSCNSVHENANYCLDDPSTTFSDNFAQNYQNSFNSLSSYPNPLESSFETNFDSDPHLCPEPSSLPFFYNDLSPRTSNDLGHKIDGVSSSSIDHSTPTTSTIGSNFSITFGQPITTYMSSSLVDHTQVNGLPSFGSSLGHSGSESNLGSSSATCSIGPTIGASLGGPSTLLTPLASAEFTGVATGTITSSLLTQPLPSSHPYDESLQGMGTGCGAYGGAPYQDPCYPTHGGGGATHVFPAMSVNVSMNMTMGVSNVNMGYGPEQALQHQWGNSCQQGGAMSPMGAVGYQNSAGTQGLVSPLPVAYSTCNQPYGMGPYSWASDFRSSDPHGFPNFDRDPCIKSPPLRPRPATPSGAYFNPIHPGTPISPNLGCLRRRPCSGPPQVDMTKGFLGESLKTNLCRICGKTYARPSTLKTHLRTHSGEKPYRCDQCNKSFSQAANLTAHVRTHSGEKPFRCPICERRFSQSSSVTTHMRTHSGDRPYRCRMCKKAFSDSSTLTKHLRIHSGEKPYQCKLCLLRFSQSGNLNRHMRVHSQAS